MMGHREQIKYSNPRQRVSPPGQYGHVTPQRCGIARDITNGPRAKSGHPFQNSPAGPGSRRVEHHGIAPSELGLLEEAHDIELVQVHLWASADVCAGITNRLCSGLNSVDATTNTNCVGDRAGKKPDTAVQVQHMLACCRLQQLVHGTDQGIGRTGMNLQKPPVTCHSRDAARS